MTFLSATAALGNDTADSTTSHSKSLLNAMGESEKLELRNDIAKIIDEVVTKGIVDLTKMHDKWQQDVIEGQVSLEIAMTLNAIRESKRFDTRVDHMVGSFLNETAVSRERTHFLHHEAEIRELQRQKEEGHRKNPPKPTEPWGRTNNAYDDWDDWNTW